MGTRTTFLQETHKLMLLLQKLGYRLGLQERLARQLVVVPNVRQALQVDRLRVARADHTLARRGRPTLALLIGDLVGGLHSG